jgi:exonuclease SbcD
MRLAGGDGMKIGVVGDLHLGAGADLALDPALATRLEEQTAIWERIGSAMREMDVVLLTGDAFHRRRPTPAELIAFRRGLTAMGTVPVIAIPGNHDIATAGEPNALTVFDRDVVLATKPRLIPVPRLDLDVACLPWTPPQWYRATNWNPMMNGTDTNTDVSWLLEQAALGLAAQCSHSTRILMLHWSLDGAALPNGKPVADLPEPRLNPRELAALGFTHIIAGHIHKPQNLPGVSVPCFYHGTPWMVDWGEWREPHGYVVIEPGHPPVHWPMPDNRYVSVTCDLVEAVESARRDERPVVFQDEIERAAGGRDALADRIVRFRYRCTEAQRSAIDEGMLRRLLVDMGAARVFSVGAEVQRGEREHVSGVDETIDPLEAFRAWCDSERIEDHVRAGLVTQTQKYLEAVE